MRSPSLSVMTGKPRLSTREVTTLAAMGALMFMLKIAMAALPNIHPVAVFIIAGTLCFGWHMLYAVGAYIMLEGLVYGFGLWWVSYLYIWPALVAIVMLLSKNEGRLFWAVIAAIFGLCFGALCALPYFAIGGAATALSYWAAGIPYDLVHAAGNFVLTFALLPTILKTLRAVSGR